MEWGRSSWQRRVASIHFRRKDMVLPTTLQSFHDRCYWIVELLFDEELPKFLTTNMPDDDRVSFPSSLRLPAATLVVVVDGKSTITIETDCK